MEYRIFDEVQASATKIVVKKNRPICVLLSPAQYESLMETLSDYILLEEAGKCAAANDNKDNVSMEAMMEQFGMGTYNLVDVDVKIE